MKDWLEKQVSKEDVVLDVLAEQSRQVADDLLPQIRLAALEDQMKSTVVMTVTFEFDEESVRLHTEGSVQFPAKHSSSAEVSV